MRYHVINSKIIYLVNASGKPRIFQAEFMVQQRLHHGMRMKKGPLLAKGPLSKIIETAQVFINSKNSALFFVLRNLSSRKSIPSIVPIGLRIRRSTYIFFRTCGSVIKLVFARARARNVDRREGALVRNLAIEDQFGIARSFELFKDDIVHTAAESNEGGGHNRQTSTFLYVAGGAEKRLGRCRALESKPPESTRPLEGVIVL